MKTAREIFHEWKHKSVNMFTPIVVDYVKINDHTAAEISKSRDGDRLFGGKYGVTVVSNGQNDYDRSKLCGSYEEAVAYIDTL